MFAWASKGGSVDGAFAGLSTFEGIPGVSASGLKPLLMLSRRYRVASRSVTCCCKPMTWQHCSHLLRVTQSLKLSLTERKCCRTTTVLVLASCARYIARNPMTTSQKPEHSTQAISPDPFRPTAPASDAWPYGLPTTPPVALLIGASVLRLRPRFRIC